MWRFLLILCLANTAFGLEEDWRVQLLNERYQDFFNRLKEKEAYDRVREAGAKDLVKERRDWSREMDVARRDYIRNRKAPPDDGPGFREWAAAQKQWLKEHDMARIHYVEIENRIHLLERSAKKIPENVEYDLQP